MTKVIVAVVPGNRPIATDAIGKSTGNVLWKFTRSRRLHSNYFVFNVFIKIIMLFV